MYVYIHIYISTRVCIYIYILLHTSFINMYVCKDIIIGHPKQKSFSRYCVHHKQKWGEFSIDRAASIGLTVDSVELRKMIEDHRPVGLW